MSASFVPTVIKRDGTRVPAEVSKIQRRLETCVAMVPALGQVASALPTITKEIVAGLVDGVDTRELDDLAVRTCASRGGEHPEFLELSKRIRVSALHKETESLFSRNILSLPRVSEETKAFVREHAVRLDAYIRPERDYLISFFGISTLERAYLLRDADNKIGERPSGMWMRVAIGIAGQDSLQDVLECYDLMSKLVYTHATPTVFNSGTTVPQLSSCFLLTMKADSIGGIYETLTDCAHISKNAGGIGLAIHDIRATGARIKGTGGTSNGLVPMLRVFNETARYVDQGGGKRKGSIACYLEPWHADVFEFLDLRKNTGAESARCRDLPSALDPRRIHATR